MKRFVVLVCLLLLIGALISGCTADDDLAQRNAELQRENSPPPLTSDSGQSVNEDEVAPLEVETI